MRKPNNFEEQFLPDCAPPPEKPESKVEETTQDLGWATITKQKTYEFDADQDAFVPNSAPPRIVVRLRLDHKVIFEMPYVGHLSLDQVADNLSHCEERMAWYRGFKKELEEQLEALTLGCDQVYGEEWVAAKSITKKTCLRRRNECDEPAGTVV